MNDRVKEIVSRKAIKHEISIARKKLNRLQQSRLKSPAKREAVFRQLVQLELCEKILSDIHIMT